MSFTKLESSDFVISSNSVVSTVWTGDVPTLTNSFYTSSLQEASSSFYLEVYNTGSALSGSEVQFSIAYGHLYGSGSQYYNDLVPGQSPTRTIYGQFRNLVYGDENTNFNFGINNSSSRDICVLSINRARYKESLFPSTFNLTITGSGASKLLLTNNSKDTTVVNYCDAGRIYDIVSGSSGNAVTTAYFAGVQAGYTNSGSYGKFLPDIGLIILNPRAITLPVAAGGLNLAISESADTDNNNNRVVFNSINNFQLNAEETISSDYVFVRVKNSEFNYTTNPSMISGSGDFVYSDFINNPQTYITTVGLYNDNNDLLAVAKLSKPLDKNFVKESLLRIKLDF